MLCEKCGARAAEGKSFCAKCESKMSVKKSKVQSNTKVSSALTDTPKSLYRHSGKVSPLMILGALLTCLAAVVLAFVYAYAVVYIPIVGYLSFLLTAGFSFGVAFTAGFFLQVFNARNTLFSVFFGLIIGLFALYASWVAFEFVVINRYSDDGIRLMEIAFSPVAVWNIACNIAENGWYSLGSTNVKGIALWILWGIEGVIITGFSIYMCYTMIIDAVFCEACREWADSHSKVLNFKYNNQTDLEERVLHHDLSFWDNATKIGSSDKDYYSITFSLCSTCKKLYTLTLKKVKRSWDKENEEELKEKILIRNLFISKSIIDHFKVQHLNEK